MLEEPQQRLAYRAQLQELGENQFDGFLNTTVRVLLQTLVLSLQIPGRRRYHELSAARLLAPGFDRALAEQIKLILVQAPLQSQEQTVVALARGVNGLLVDQQRIDDAAYLDQKV